MDIKLKIEQINENIGYKFDKEVGLTRSNKADELRSISIISNIEQKSYDSSYSKEEMEELKTQKNFSDKKEFQLFGDDVHKILELAFDNAQTKDAICEKMTSIQAKIDFENLYNTVIANLDSVCTKLNLDKNKFYPELKVCDGYNHGKFDLVAQTLDGKNIIIDYKTSYNITINYKLQINMYRNILQKYYDIPISEAYIIKVDKETYSFSLIPIEIIEPMFIDPLLQNGMLADDLVKKCIDMHINSEDDSSIKINLDVEKKNLFLVDDVVSYQQQIKSLKIVAAEKFADYKNIKKEIDDLNVMVESKLNEILKNVDLNTLGDEYKINNTDLTILKKDKANGNSPKFIEKYNNKEAIVEFCQEHATDFFNNVTDIRSLKSYMWKNFEELHTPKWQLSVKLDSDNEQ